MTTHSQIYLNWARRVCGPLLGALLMLASAGCATVRPEQRAILADPSMQFEDKSADRAALRTSGRGERTTVHAMMNDSGV